jgi:hypothetical protein
MDTTHLLLPYLLASQAQKHVTHNEALRLLDAMVQLAVLDRTRTVPPAPAVAEPILTTVSEPAAPSVPRFTVLVDPPAVAPVPTP